MRCRSLSAHVRHSAALLGQPEQLGQLRAALRRHPAHHLRKGVVPRHRPVFPEAGVFELRELDRLGDEPIDQRHHRAVLVDDARVGEDRLEAQNQLAHEVVLILPVGALPTRTGPTPSKPEQMRQQFLDEIPLAANAVQRLQRAGVGDVAQEADERLAFGEVAQAPQRFDDERGVAQPAEAVVPGAHRIERFGDAGRGGGDDRAGIAEGVQLQAQRRAQHGLGGKGRQRARLRPLPPAGDRELERALDRRGRIDLGRPPAAQDEIDRPIDAERKAALDVVAAECSSAGRAATVRRESRGRRRSARTRRVARP